jgi:hypothetical protein
MGLEKDYQEENKGRKILMSKRISKIIAPKNKRL